MTNQPKPGLFGLANSNKDFSDEMSWGKNQFNNTFPVALANYMASRKMSPVYIRLNKELATFKERCLDVMKKYDRHNSFNS